MNLSALRAAAPVRVRARVDLPISIDGAARRAQLCSFSDLPDEREHVALALGRFAERSDGVPLVRVHSECLTGDIFGSHRCDCGPQLAESLRAIDRVGGYLVYLRQEGRAIGLYAKLDAYLLQDQGLDTFAANRALGYPGDARDYHVAGHILGALGVHRCDLLTGNPDKTQALTATGISVRRVVPTRRYATPQNLRYLAAKEEHGHVFSADRPTR